MDDFLIASATGELQALDPGIELAIRRIAHIRPDPHQVFKLLLIYFNHLLSRIFRICKCILFRRIAISGHFLFLQFFAYLERCRNTLLNLVTSPAWIIWVAFISGSHRTCPFGCLAAVLSIWATSTQFVYTKVPCICFARSTLLKRPLGTWWLSISLPNIRQFLHLLLFICQIAQLFNLRLPSGSTFMGLVQPIRNSIGCCQIRWIIFHLK